MTLRRNSEAGQSTLVEIFASLLVLGIVMALLFSTIESAERTVAGTKLRITNLDEARTLMAVLTKDLRTATRLEAGTAPFLSGEDREVIFFANLDNPTGGPRRVRIHVDSTNEIIASVQAPDDDSVPPAYTYSGAPKLRYVGRTWPTPARNRCSNISMTPTHCSPPPLSDNDKLAVASVRITLIVRAASSLSVGAVTLVDEVRLPNVDYQSAG